MKTDNRSNGGRFEQRLSKILSKAGFWVHVMQQNKAGQPADIVAMGMFTKRCDEACWFALELPDKSIWMLSMNTIRKMESAEMKGISEEELRRHPWTIEEWLKSADVWSVGDV